jgi:hypothetical protein
MWYQYTQHHRLEDVDQHLKMHTYLTKVNMETQNLLVDVEYDPTLKKLWQKHQGQLFS